MSNIENTCWQLFNKTGEVGYYLLYKAIKETEESVTDGTN